ncbi:MAG: hypothetical protein TUN42_07500 [Dehalogenimonas sp.]
MNSEELMAVQVTLKNGHSFGHKMPKLPHDEMVKHYHKVANNLVKKGVMAFRSPLAMIRVEDISSIHFLGTDDDILIEENREPMGFQILAQSGQPNANAIEG